MLTARQEQELIDLTRRLVQAPSLTGQEGEMAALVKDQMTRMGYQVSVDDWGNVVGTLQGRGQGSVLFDAHMDTVPVQREQWQHDPFGGAVVGSRIYGRGTSDMKGALAAALYGIGLLAAGADELGTVHVSASVCEEPAEGPALVEVCRRLRPGCVVIQEATQLRVNRGQRGRAELQIETFGQPAHSSTPHLGVNAVLQMNQVIAAIAGLQLPVDDLLGPAILVLTDIKSNPYPGLSVVPYGCHVTYDRRLLVADTPASVLGQIEAILQRLQAADPSFRGEVRLAETAVATYTGARFVHRAFAPAWKYPAAHPLVTTAVQSLQGIGQSAVLGHYNFCTNGSGSAGVLGIPTIGYGPGREEEAHINDEFLEVDQLIAAANGYRALARSLSTLAL